MAVAVTPATRHRRPSSMIIGILRAASDRPHVNVYWPRTRAQHQHEPHGYIWTTAPPLACVLSSTPSLMRERLSGQRPNACTCACMCARTWPHPCANLPISAVTHRCSICAPPPSPTFASLHICMYASVHMLRIRSAYVHGHVAGCPLEAATLSGVLGTGYRLPLAQWCGHVVAQLPDLDLPLLSLLYASKSWTRSTRPFFCAIALAVWLLTSTMLISTPHLSSPPPNSVCFM